MHELSLAQDIIAIVKESLEPQAGVSLKTVRVSIGEMAAVVPELLHHAYDALIADTPLQGSKLDIAIIPVTAICHSCKKTFGLEEYEFLCPNCQSSDIEVLTGDEFFIKDLVVA